MNNNAAYKCPGCGGRLNPADRPGSYNCQQCGTTITEAVIVEDLDQISDSNSENEVVGDTDINIRNVVKDNREVIETVADSDTPAGERARRLLEQLEEEVE